jgi:hypothetical protein
MVSNADPGRASRRSALVVVGALVLASSLLGQACSRRQNLVDERDSGGTITPPPACDEDIPEVLDSGIQSEELALCAERPFGDCQGSNDFPCEFELWFQSVVDACQASSTCRPGGCVEAQVDDSGCVKSVHMTEADSAFVACLVETFGAYRCPCGVTAARRFLGVSSGCHRPCGTGEQICPSGETCIDGFCEPSGAGGGG